MKVAWTIHDAGGSTFYRQTLPLSMARARGGLQALSVSGFDMNRLEIAGKVISEADILMMGRVNDPHFLNGMEHFHKEKKKIVVDWDDDIFNVSPLSQQYRLVGTEDFDYRMPGGEVINVWKDGEKGFDIRRNRRTIETIKDICAKADALFVTNEHLRGVYGKFNERIFVLPNCLDMDVWRRLPLRPRINEVRMGWFGGDSHFGDWCMVTEALQAVLFKYPYLKLVILGKKFEASLRGIHPGQIEHHPWVHLEAYPYKAAGLDLDFAIIPLEDKLFNHGKSTIKWIEMGALKIPAVTSFVPPYTELMDLFPDNGIFVENQPDAWIAAIEKMVEDQQAREEMGSCAYETVRRHFDINQKFQAWINAFQEVYKCQPRPIQTSTLS